MKLPCYALIVCCAALSILTVFAAWEMLYHQSLVIPPVLIDVFPLWKQRITLYKGEFRQKYQMLDGFILHRHNRPSPQTQKKVQISSNGSKKYLNDDDDKSIKQRRVKEMESEKIFPSRFGSYIYSNDASHGLPTSPKIVCYYTTPMLNAFNKSLTNHHQKFRHILLPEFIDPYLCTHLNIGIIGIVNSTLYMDKNIREALERIKGLKKANPILKILLWVGGARVGGFSTMVKDHTSRKSFIQSLKMTLEQYHMDGVDLDWEFPGTDGKTRVHFSQLLHEIRQINNYADYVNLMSYDYHFYSSELPQTGLNAPLFRREHERSLLGTLNINESVHYWLAAGLDRSKLVVGLPTYGHSFSLLNPFNTRIGAPTNNFGRVGTLGFASYSEICWFRRCNIYAHRVYDIPSCSPYLYAGSEWISYDDEQSLACKATFIKSQGFGGAMIFSLNTDDFGAFCEDATVYLGKPTDALQDVGTSTTFPLLRTIRSILLGDVKFAEAHRTMEKGLGLKAGKMLV
ncbi:chitinase-3-like protein 2 isoform X2 [Anopheles nili]|uniref:chitinase-3-like protein 2 isoform X2 n=1 Tax=Anopheles nili TaxID=185578 RepID=UPI00237B4992|nr:chitinase-3-like protein 2 isoform X2 [Anopheles nili]